MGLCEPDEMCEERVEVWGLAQAQQGVVVVIVEMCKHVEEQPIQPSISREEVFWQCHACVCGEGWGRGEERAREGGKGSEERLCSYEVWPIKRPNKIQR